MPAPRVADSSSSGAILNFDSALPDLAVDLKLVDLGFLSLTEMILMASAWLDRLILEDTCCSHQLSDPGFKTGDGTT